MRDGLEDEEPREDPVPLRKVEGDAEAPGFLSADRHLARHHPLGDVLEADRRDVEGDAEARGDAVDEERGRERLRDAAGEPTAGGEALGEEREDPVRRHEAPGGVEDPEAVAVSVAREGDVVLPARQRVARRAEVVRDGLGIDAAEERVARRPERRDARRVAGPDDLREERARRPVHRVEEDVQARAADGVEVDPGGDRVAIRRHGGPPSRRRRRRARGEDGRRSGRPRRRSRASRCLRTTTSPSRRSTGRGCGTR